MNWIAGFITGALVLPVGALSAVTADDKCNHLVGDIMVAEPDTPRGAWCDAFQWDSHWLLLMIPPAALTLLLVLFIGRRPQDWAWAWGVGGLLAWVPVIILSGLRGYYEI